MEAVNSLCPFDLQNLAQSGIKWEEGEQDVWKRSFIGPSSHKFCNYSHQTNLSALLSPQTPFIISDKSSL